MQNTTARDSNNRLGILEFITIMLPLLAVASAIQLLDIEKGLLLPPLMWMAVVGFALYAWLPMKLRLPAFLVLNLVALFVLFDPLSAVATVGFGLLLIALTSLPIKFAYRVILVAGVGTYLALVKAGIIEAYAFYQVSGIIGGLFMFRMVLYLYELRHQKEPVPVLKRVSYFFLLPNLIFQLFPIVDYKTFTRGFYAKPALETYRKGLHWIGIGVLHLLLYRMIYHYLVPDLPEVQSLPKLVQYLAFNYTLIIRLSGIFHLSVGILCLFGFDLPRTFDNYFLTSSFSDLWRRINCYWRAFMMKVFYFPILFKFKHLGKTGIFVSVILVFIVNYCLHTYQWFWVRGSVQIMQTDILFWSILGVLLAFNSILPPEKHRSQSRTKFSHKLALIRSLKVFGMFTFMCLMWSMWSSGTLDDWFSIFRQAGNPTPRELVNLLIGGVVLVGLSIVLQQGIWTWSLRKTAFRPFAGRDPAIISVGFMALCLLTVVPNTESTMGMNEALRPVLTESLNTRDSSLLTEGYYEELIIPNNLSSRVWELRRNEEQFRAKELKRRSLWGMDWAESREEKSRHQDVNNWVSARSAGLLKPSYDAIEFRYYPGKNILFHGIETKINQYGMRDREYTLEKPPNVYRIAQLGGSPEVGMGLPMELTSENLLEDRLSNAEEWSQFDRVEILNFAVGKYALLNQMGVTEKLIGPFDPDAVLLTIHDTDVFGKMNADLARGFADRRFVEYEYLSNLRQELDIKYSTDSRLARELLNPHEREIYFWALERIRQFCEERDIKLVIVYMGIMAESPEFSRATQAILFPYFRSNDYTVFDLKDIFEVPDKSKLIIAPWDLHPNEKGHARVADRMYELMIENRDFFLD